MVNSLPTATLSGSTSICSGSSTNLSVALTGTGPWSVTYTDGTTPVTVQANASPYTIQVSPTTTRTYTLLGVSDANCSGTFTGSATITVNTKPSLTVPTLAAVNNEADKCGAAVSFAAMATGTPTPVVSYKLGETGITSPYFFSVGSNMVTATATNTCGTEEKAFTVTVNDNQAPVISTNGNKSVNNDPGKCGAAVTVTASATDNCSVGNPSGVRSDNKALTDDFPVGTTIITWNVTDANGKAALPVSQTVVVTDNEAPVITTTAVTLTLNTAGTATLSATDVKATDNCGTPAISLSKSSFSCADLGTKPISVTATDVNGKTTAGTVQVSVVNQVTTLMLTSTPSVQYSDVITLSATLKAGGTGVGGQTISFTAGAQSVTAVTDGSGVAGTTLAINQAPTSYQVIATYAGVCPFAASTSGTNTLLVTKEDARATYTGTFYAAGSSLNATQATVTLSATIQDITVVDPTGDPNSGDIRKATVTFVNRDAGNAVLGTANVTVGLVNPGDLKTGTATTTVSLPISNAGFSNYTIGIIVDGYYTRNNSADNVVVNVATPQNDFITGGGFINLTSSAGLMAGDAGTRSNFGFNVKYNKNGTSLQGNINVITRRMESDGILHVYQIKGNAMTSLTTQPTAAGGKATFEGKANIQDITDPANVVSVDGNATLQVTMTDNGESGTTDAIGITVWNKAGGLWFASTWDGVRTQEKTLVGGNLVVKGAKVGAREAAAEAVSAEIPAPLQVEVYPNPAVTNTVSVQISGAAQKPVRLQLLDLKGRMVSEHNLEVQDQQHIQQLDISNSPSGMLLLRVSTPEQSQTRKLIKP
ncbi:hypothetical protein GCM10023187_47500 [Nibrella viscosa]|uniref:Por secretion system C-terminal sorting domain-containing protein n=1 Tax=Nibrella viscosa TaxID=1084524 RepID=A0ABP8KV14_9BACT